MSSPPSGFNLDYLSLAIHQKDYLGVKRYLSKTDVNRCLSNENQTVFHYLLDRIMIDPKSESLPSRDLRLILLLLEYGANPEQKNSTGETVHDRLLKFGYKIDRKYLVRHYSYRPPLPPSPPPEITALCAEDLERELFRLSLPSANRDFHQKYVATTNIYQPFFLTADDYV
jgi:hypothetical protein